MPNTPRTCYAQHTILSTQHSTLPMVGTRHSLCECTQVVSVELNFQEPLFPSELTALTALTELRVVLPKVSAHEFA